MKLYPLPTLSTLLLAGCAAASGLTQLPAPIASEPLVLRQPAPQWKENDPSVRGGLPIEVHVTLIDANAHPVVTLCQTIIVKLPDSGGERQGLACGHMEPEDAADLASGIVDAVRKALDLQRTGAQ